MPERPGLGVELDRERVEEAHALYWTLPEGGRDDAAPMRQLVPGWTFDPKRPAMVGRP